jgi:3D (Asp-Asp-Asp) domain-containing protein
VEGCRTVKCRVRVGRRWAKTHPPKPKLSPHYTVSSTCYAQGGTTASGRQTFVGEVANNSLPLGTRIRLDRPVFGRREFVVLDRIGSGSELDIYEPSEATCLDYGRREIGFRVER